MLLGIKQMEVAYLMARYGLYRHFATDILHLRRMVNP